VKRIYVGNLPWTTTDTELQTLFSPYGTVHSVAVINDRETGRSRGFGFVEMDDSEADRAIEELNGRDFGGRALRINEAQERQRRPPGGGGGGGRW
jgi:RNA recognition motif-containing protein